MKLIQWGPRDAKIMLVGEAPADNEMSQGRPFVGGAGQLLEHAASRSGLSVSSCFQTNVVHEPAPYKKFDNFYKKQHQAAYIAGLLQLKKDIETIRPNVVVALGTNALLPLAGKKGIDKWRGSILPSGLVKGQKVIGTYNPAYALRVYEAKAIIELDLKRVASESATPDICLPKRSYLLDPPGDVRAACVREMLNADWLAVDIECWLDESTGKWKLACVGFSDRADRALVIPATTADRILDIRCLVESDVKKVYQNGQFDTTVLTDEGFRPRGYAWDTMYAHHALFAEAASGDDELTKLMGKKKLSVFKKGLAFQTSIYTREPFYKDDGKVSHQTGDTQLFYLYNGRDGAVTREIRDVQEAELDAFGTRCVFDHEMAMLPPLMYATRRGIRIDLEQRAHLKDQIQKEIDNLQNFLDGQAGSHINVKSPDVKHLMYDVLKLPLKYNKKTGNVTADKDAINDLAEKFKHPVLLTILKIRERRDYIERYLDIQLGPDGRMRCLFDPSGTRSGRLASRTNIDGSGTNLQTIPTRKAVGEQIKRMFIADSGKMFIYPDYKQAEAWLVAYMAKCEPLIELLNDPARDIHKENASRIFGIPLAEVTKEQRYLAKRVVHASNYGMGPDKLVKLCAEDGVHLSDHKAHDLMARYFMVYPEIKGVYWKYVEEQIKWHRVLDTPFGRKRAFFGRYDDKLLREAYSYVPQSTVGDLGGKAVVRVYQEVQLGMADLGAEFLLNVHDSILVQCNETMVARTAEAVREAMRIPITVDGRTFTIPTDCKIGRNWGARLVAKDGSIINPAGLRDIEDGEEGLWAA